MRIVVLAFLAAVGAFAADSFAGKWASAQSGNSGEIRITVAPEPKVSFTASGSEVSCTIVSSRVEPDSIEIVYDFILQGYKLRSTVKGTVKDGRLAGKYTTKVVDEGSLVDSGTFEATAK